MMHTETDIFSSLQELKPAISVSGLGQIMGCNRMFSQLFGYDEQELREKGFQLLKSGVHEVTFYDNLWKTLKNGQTWQSEICNRHQNGSHVWAELVIVPDTNGTYVAVYTDITYLKKVIQKLHQSEWLLSEAQAVAKIGGWRYEMAGEKLIWTAEVYRIHEIDQLSELSIDKAISFYAPYEQAKIRILLERAIEFAEPFNQVFDFISAKGRKLKVRTAGEPFYSQGQVAGLRGTFQDITDVYRTREALQEERLKSIQASKLAYLGQVSAGIAHEINNPLAIISGYSAAIQNFIRKGNTEKALDRLSKLDSAISRIEKIISNMRTFVRDQADADYEACDIHDIIQNAIEMSSPYIARAGAWVACNNKSIRVTGNFVELVQVIVNLVSNACAAIDSQNDAWIRIDVEDDDGARIIITDSGPGIEKKHLEKIFKPFYTTKATGEGTGLGLSISKEIIEMHGGRITYNQKSPNTQFIVSLPAND